MNDWNNSFAANKKSVNPAIVIITTVVFLILEIWEKTATKGDFYGNTTRFLLDHGALYAPSVLRGEWYRLFTYQFLHSGVQHLMSNMLLLYFIGNFVERYIGRIRYVVLYVGSGILAGFGSILYNGCRLTGTLSFQAFYNVAGFPVCVGASGAVFGVMGAMLYLVLVHKGRLQDFKPQFLVLFVVLSLCNGFLDTGIDNAAHITGLAGGIVLAVFLYGRPKHHRA